MPLARYSRSAVTLVLLLLLAHPLSSDAFTLRMGKENESFANGFGWYCAVY